MLLIMSMFFVGIGAFVLGNALVWRRHARRVTGVVLGVQAGGQRKVEPETRKFSAVYRYTGALGQPVDATSSYASRNFAALRTGRRVALFVFDDEPAVVREAGNCFLEFFAVTFVLGGFLMFPPLAQDRILALEVAIFAAGLCLGYTRSRRGRRAIPVADPVPAGREGGSPENFTVDVMSVPGAVADGQRSTGGRIGNAVGALLIVGLGLGAAAAGIGTGRAAVRLAIDGVDTVGEVISVKDEAPSDGGADFPVIEFATINGSLVRIEDQRTFFSSTYHVGDKVRVVYLATEPAATAGTDSPFRALVVATMLVFLGGTFVFFGFRAFRDFNPGDGQ